MGWAAALLVVLSANGADAASRPDFELRVRQQAVERLVRAVFPMDHELGIPPLGVSMGVVTLSDPRVRIESHGVILRTRMTARSGRAEAVGPARFVFRPRYDPERRGLCFDLIESEADLAMGGRRLGTLDLSWVASALFIPTGQWIQSETGPLWLEFTPEARLRPGEIILYGRIRVKKGRPARRSGVEPGR
jgi:hypothetical protein